MVLMLLVLMGGGAGGAGVRAGAGGACAVCKVLMVLVLTELVQGDAVDREQALLLCRQTGFTPGLLHLHQQAGLYDQILQVGTVGTRASLHQSTNAHYPAAPPGPW
jgi:hypothetical protein